MTSAYRVPGRYRSPYRSRRGAFTREQVIGAVLVLLVVTGAAKAAARHGVSPAHRAVTAAASQAIAFARGRLGCPYAWGGTGPCAAGYDCSGLVMEAYASAGVRLARTSQEQWATEPHVPSPQPGDLVFFAGSDGTMTAPGHVGIVIGGGQMIEAYATGFPVRVASYSRPDLVGFSQPWGGAS